MTTDEYMCGACGYIATSPTVMVQHYRAAHAETGVVPPAVANIGGITPAERARLAALLAQATPGPWSVDVDRPDEGELVITIPQIERTLHHPEWAQRSERRRDMANARLIVAAVNSLPALLAACEAAEAHVHDALERVGALTRERDEARALAQHYVECSAGAEAYLDARDAYRRGAEAMRERASVMLRAFVDADHRVGRDVRTLREAADAIAALPITDAEEVDRGA